MDLQDVTTWLVSYGKARPKNNTEYTHISKGFAFVSFSEPSEQWLQFEKFASLHTYATDAEKGQYDASLFEQPVWQIHLYGEWRTMQDISSFTIEYMRARKHGFRQFLLLKQQEKKQPIQLTGHIGDSEYISSDNHHPSPKDHESVNIIQEIAKHKSAIEKLEKQLKGIKP